MAVTLTVVGADNARREDTGLGVPVEHFEDWGEAIVQAVLYANLWKGVGFKPTSAGIYVRGSEWRLVMVVDVESGIQWRPKEVVR